PAPELVERGGDARVRHVPVEIDEEHVVPGPPPRRPRLDLAEVHPVVRERRQGVVQAARSEEHTSELQSRVDLVCRLLLAKKNELGTGESDRTGAGPKSPTQHRIPVDFVRSVWVWSRIHRTGPAMTLAER